MKRILKFIVLLLWMGIIFYLSSQTGSDSSDTSNLVTDIIYRIYVFIFRDNVIFDEMTFIDTFASFFRKLAHFSEFAILGILMYVNIKEYRKDKIVLIAIILSVIYAISDEIHQLFVINRYCSIFDMMIDSLGSISGIVLYHLFRR